MTRPTILRRAPSALRFAISSRPMKALSSLHVPSACVAAARARPAGPCPAGADSAPPRRPRAAPAPAVLRGARALGGAARGPGCTILARGVRAEELQHVRPILRSVRGVLYP